MPLTPQSSRRNIVNEALSSRGSRQSTASDTDRPDSETGPASKRSSHELEYAHDGTRDSLVANLLDSFSHFPGADAPPSHPPSSYHFRGSSSDTPQTPRAGWATTIRHIARRSRSSTETSRDTLRTATLQDPGLGGATRNIDSQQQQDNRNRSRSRGSLTMPNTPRRSRELPRETVIVTDKASFSTHPTSFTSPRTPISPTLPSPSSPRHQKSKSRGNPDSKSKSRSKGSVSSLDRGFNSPSQIHYPQQSSANFVSSSISSLGSRSRAETPGSSAGLEQSTTSPEPMQAAHQIHSQSSGASTASRTNTPDTMLTRARPVPGAYHDFHDASWEGLRVRSDASDNQMRPNDFAAFTHSRSFPGNENVMMQSGSRNKLSALLGADPQQPGAHAQNYNRKTSMTPASAPAAPPFPSPASINYSDQGRQMSAGTDGVVAEERRERHGFFKRVFGGTSSKSLQPERAPQLPPLQDPVSQPTATAHITTAAAVVTTNSVPKKVETKISHPNIANQNPDPSQYAHIPIPTEELPDPTMNDGARPVLHKKSSFFRRRRKTAGERDAVSRDEVSKQGNLADGSRPSMSSLRQALNPYLDQRPASPSDSTFYDSREHQSNDDVSGAEAPYAYTSRTGTPSKSANRSEIPPRAHAGSVASSRADTSSRLPSDQSTTALKSRLKPLDPAGSTPKSVKRLSQSKSQPQLRGAYRRGQEDEHSHRTRPELPTKPLNYKPGRVWLRQNSSDEKLSDADVSAESKPNQAPRAPDEGVGEAPKVRLDSASRAKTEPNTADLEIAQKLFNDDADSVQQSKAAILLGQPGLSGERLRQAYMDHHDFAGNDILQAMRELCERLVLKGETQQVDRILSSFSQRWCDCNSNHGFKSHDIVHTICYSLLLLNTDIYIADVEQKMTQKQFIRNTLPTIKALAQDLALNQDATIRTASSTTRPPSAWREDTRSPSPSSPVNVDFAPSHDSRMERDTNRLSLRPPPLRRGSDHSGRASPSLFASGSSESVVPLVNSPIEGGIKAWENQVEMVLKDFYSSIRSQRLPLHGANDQHLHTQPSSNSLSVLSPSLHRSGSVISKAASMDNRPLTAEHRSHSASGASGRWAPRNKSRQRGYHSSTLGSSSRTSFDDPSVWSPSTSSIFSKNHYARTLPSMSSESLASRYTAVDQGFQQSIGFANALSHAIIREETNNTDEEYSSADGGKTTAALLEDESLELEGAPWAKEGIVHHKHHLETTDKKAKSKSWNECFVVVEKGWVRLFSFNSRAASRSQKNKTAKGAVVGGGNWMDNAESLNTFMLRHTIANVLPPPGYSKTRPHVFALSLPTGAVHLFQVGTPEIAQEFVSTANYWSARLSKEPLVGGVSNIEYGWSDNIITSAEFADPAMTRASTTPTPASQPGSGTSAVNIVGHIRNRSKSYSASQHSRTQSGRPSFQDSVRSSIDLQGGARPKLPGDRINLSDWSPPQQSMMASQLSETDQLTALRAYILDVEQDLTRHNDLRPSLMKAFSTRHPNASKAAANWERKSSHLLREIVKFRTYIDSLAAAQLAHKRVKAEREFRDQETRRLKAEAAAALDPESPGANSGLGIPEGALAMVSAINSRAGSKAGSVYSEEP